MPPMPPEYGYGPVNYADQGGDNPFRAFDNRIRYNDMVRHQMVSQYQQSIVRPSSMTISQARDVATQQRFQYGVQGGQDPRMYERRAELSRTAYGTSMATSMADIGSWGVAEAGLMAAGFGTMSASLLAMPLTLPVMHFVNKGVQNAVDRRKFMHSMASDVEQYRDRLGFSGGISYTQATELGGRLEQMMSEPGQFFNKEQQARIHKIGLSNDLLSARGSSVDSGTINQYEKNVKELIETTEDVVKLLQTTTEGGLSVIKELKQKGFGNIQQIRQQVLQAKAFGGLTGLGSQNMMNIGAAGAQAVQGTPWSAAAGANMYQYGAAQAHMVAQASKSGAYAVQRAGGTAAAGAAIGNFAMNMLQSGIGTKLAAYAMNPDLSVDSDRMSRMLSGQAGAYEIVTGANRTGYMMGENRVRFGMFKEDMLNSMTPQQQMRMVSAGFNAWSKQRPYSSAENLAAAFSQNFAVGARDQRIMYEYLLSNKGFAQISAAGRAEAYALNQATPTRRLGAVGKAIKGGYESFTGFFNELGAGLEESSRNMLTTTSGLWGGFKRGVADIGEDVLQGVGIWDEYGRINRAKYGDIRQTVRRSYGLFETSPESQLAFKMSSAADLKSLKVMPKKMSGVDVTKLVEKHGQKGVNYAIQKLWQAQAEGSAEQAYLDPDVASVFGIERGSLKGRAATETTLGILERVRGQVKSSSAKLDEAKSEFDKEFPKDSKNRAQAMAEIQTARNMMTLNSGDVYFRRDIEAGKLGRGFGQDDKARGGPAREDWIMREPTNEVTKKLILAESNARKLRSTNIGPETAKISEAEARKKLEAKLDETFGPEYETRSFRTRGGSIFQETARSRIRGSGLKKYGYDLSEKKDQLLFLERMMKLETRNKATEKGGEELSKSELEFYEAGFDIYQELDEETFTSTSWFDYEIYENELFLVSQNLPEDSPSCYSECFNYNFSDDDSLLTLSVSGSAVLILSRIE